MNLDTLSLILRYCKFLPLRLVCKQWNNIIEQFPVSASNYIEHLNIVSYSEYMVFIEDLYKLENLVNLTELTLDTRCSSGYNIHLNLSKLTYLECLNIDDITFKCPNLTTLKLDYTNVKGDFNNLTKLCIGENCDFGNDDLENLTNLTTLKIFDYTIGDRGLRNLTNLTKLEFTSGDITNINHLVNLESLIIRDSDSFTFCRNYFPHLLHMVLD